MKILYHHRTRATDAQRVHILEIVQAFRGLGHQVEIVSLVETDGAQRMDREVAEVGWKKVISRIPFAHEAVQLGYNLVGFPLLLSKTLAVKPDFIYERYSLFNFTGVLVARLTGRPLILEVNSPFAIEQKADREIWAERFAQWTERLICSAATKVIVVSSPLRRIMARIGVPDDKLVLMSNGVNRDHMKPAVAPPSLRRSLGLEGKVVIGFVGWFRPWHGLEFLLKAFHHSGLAGQNVGLLLIGHGPALPELKRYVAANGLENAVVFTGALPHDDVPKYLDIMDIAVQPAANEYCCPMKILEYLALGKPLVGPRQENIQELVREGVDALLYPPDDEAALIGALCQLALDQDTRLAMARNARQAIEERGYLWSRNAQRVIDLVASPRRAVAGRSELC
jgi:glycosyltransferase involved in cell wall biosynthesis